MAGRHPTVAIIDHYEGVRRPCVRYLGHFNFDVAEAADAEQGLAMLEKTRPALVLIEDDKSKAFEHMRQHARGLSIPIVSMTTAFDGMPASPAVSVLLKPFTLGNMLEEIRRVLRAEMTAGAG